MRKRKIAKTLYLSHEENEMLNKKCRELNITYSNYIRKLINDYEPKKFYSSKGYHDNDKSLKSDSYK